MRVKGLIVFIVMMLCSQLAFAVPFWDMNKVPKDQAYPTLKKIHRIKSSELKTVATNNGINVLRLQIDWQVGEQYNLSAAVIEPSGTPALIARSKNKPQWGSYQGVLKDLNGGDVYYDAIGTGKQYRKEVRAITFRFPVPTHDMLFELYAENPQSGEMERVISQMIYPAQLKSAQAVAFQNVEVKEISESKQSSSLRVNIYAEGYSASQKEYFWADAANAVQALKQEKMPGIENMSFYAVFAPSNKKLGKPRDLGKPIPEYDTFLGLFYAYWDDCQDCRWYDVIYPTSEAKFRRNLASAPYDYPIVLVKSKHYWGVGNYMAFTAIPADDSHFTYLLLHEFGHYFGLNEEYEGGGPTELEFAPGIKEPWSQNITFLRDARYRYLKWKQFVDVRTALPTPSNAWRSYPPVYGAYEGGYADSHPANTPSYKPGFNCIMDRYPHFCEVCRKGIQDVVQYSLGKK